MPINSLRFRIESDNVSAMKGLSDVQKKIKEVGNDLQNSLGGKLAASISVTVLEQAVQRTGEWALELSKASRELSISAEELQTLRIAADRAGVSQDKILSYYDKIDVKATEALAGNQKLIKSFKDLGVTASQLRSGKTSDLMTTMFSNAGNAGGGDSLINIFGPREFENIKALRREFDGNNLSGYQNQHSGQITSNDDVSSIATAWLDITTDFKTLGTVLKPIAGLILTVVDGFVKMFTGVIVAASDLIKGAFDNILHPSHMFDNNLNTGKNLGLAGQGIMKMAAGIGDFFTGGRLGLGQKAKNYFDSNDEAMGITKDKRRAYEGAGEAIATVLTSGAGPIVKGAGLGAKGASSVADFIGAESAGSTLGKLGTGLSGLSEDSGAIGKLLEKSPKFKDFAANQGMKKYGSEINKIMKDLGMDASIEPTPKEAETIGELLLQRKGMNMKQLIDSLKEDINNSIKNTSSGIAGIGMAGIAGGIGRSDINNNNPFKSGGSTTPVNRFPGTILNMGEMFTGGSSQLSTGGVFGVNLQMKIFDLTKTQTDYLSQIADNTKATADNISEPSNINQPYQLKYNSNLMQDYQSMMTGTGN